MLKGGMPVGGGPIGIGGMLLGGVAKLFGGGAMDVTGEMVEMAEPTGGTAAGWLDTGWLLSKVKSSMIMELFIIMVYVHSVTHICVSNLTIIGSDNGLSPGPYQAIIWTKAGIFLTGPLGTNFSEILIEIYTFSFKKMHLRTWSAKWHPLCLGLNMLTYPLMLWLLASPGHLQPRQ